MIYGEDLAHVHDAGFGDYGHAAGSEVLKRLDELGIVNGLVVDLGCGPGAWAARLLDKGFDVLAVDVSSAMVKLASARAPGAECVCASLDTIELPPCVAITAIGEVFNYTSVGEQRRPTSPLAEARSPEPQEAIKRLNGIFGRAADALRASRGLFVFDLLLSPVQASEVWNATRSADGAGWTCEAWIREDSARRRVTRDIAVTRSTGGKTRESVESHVLETFAREEIVQTLEASGFEVEATPCYGSYELPARRCAFFAQESTP